MDNYVFVVMVERPEAKDDSKNFNGVELYGIFTHFDHADFSIKNELRMHPEWNFMVTGGPILSHVAVA